ncbi:MAG: methyltransferase [Bacteroidia bacterium]
MSLYVESAFENVKRNQELPAFYPFEFRGKTFLGMNNVFSPIIYQDSFFFCNNLPIVEGGHFLEIGCGTGLISIHAAMQGFAQIVATDINPDAVKNVKINALLHELEDKFTCFVSNIFDEFEERFAQQFDVIFWNTPFVYHDVATISVLAKSVLGNYEEGIARYVADAKRFLKKDGRLFLGFSSTCGDFALLEKTCQAEQASLSLLAEDVIEEINVELYEIVYSA